MRSFPRNIQFEILHRNFHKIILLVSIFLYTVVFSYFGILKNYNFNSFAWDLGVFNQIFYNTIFEHKFFYYTADLFVNLSGNYFAIHVSPILIILFPFYYIFPKIETLIILKTLIIAIGAIPLYYLSNSMIKNKNLSLTIALTYLLSPAIQGANWFDFQQQIFIPVLIFSLFFFFLNEKWTYYFPVLILTLMIEEHIFSIIILVFTGYLLVYTYKNGVSELWNTKFNYNYYFLDKNRVILLSLFICILTYYFSLFIINSYNISKDFIDYYKSSMVYEVLNYNGNTLLLPFYIITNLKSTLNALLFDFDIKILNLMFIFSPLLFTPFMTIFCLPIIILLIPLFLSNFPAYYSVGAHYPLYYLPPFFISLLYAFRNNNNFGETRFVIKNILFVSIFISIIISPISPLAYQIKKNTNTLWYPEPIKNKDRIYLLHDLIELVPDNESILTQNHLFPHISSRLNAYVLPIRKFSPKQEELIVKYINELIYQSNYILIDLKQRDKWSEYVYDFAIKNDTYREYGITTSSILFRRNFMGKIKELENVNKRVFNI